MAPNNCNLYDTEPLASALFAISSRLSYMSRREEALTAIQEAVGLHRQLAANQPVAFNPYLAKSLSYLSVHLSSLSHLEEALMAIQEAVEIHRQLITDQHAAFPVFNPDLTRYAHTGNLTICPISVVEGML